MSDNYIKYVGGCFVCYGIITIIVCILIGVSFSTVGVNEVALKQNKYSKNIDQTTIYKAGRYRIGLTNKFLIYQITWKLIEFSSETGGTQRALFSLISFY